MSQTPSGVISRRRWLRAVVVVVPGDLTDRLDDEGVADRAAVSVWWSWRVTQRLRPRRISRGVRPSAVRRLT